MKNNRPLLGILVFFFAFSGCVSLGTLEKNVHRCAEIQDGRADCEEELQLLQEKVLMLEAAEADRMAGIIQAEVVKEKRDEETDQDVKRILTQLKEGLRDLVSKDQVQLSVRGAGVAIFVGKEGMFYSGRVRLRSEEMRILKQVAAVLLTIPSRTIRVVGHSDGLPIAGDFQKFAPSNWELSAVRAAAVIRYLQSEGGIPPEEFVLTAHAGNRPLVSNDTPEGRRRNRRVEIIVEGKKQPVADPPRPPVRPEASPAPIPKKLSTEPPHEKP